MNKKTGRMGVLIVFLIGFLLTSSLLSTTVAQNTEDVNREEFNRKTLVLGTVINPSLHEGVWTAQALHVFYYQSGLFVHQGGTVKPMTTITFSDDMFISVWTPGPFELIGYVFGVTNEFTIIDG